MVPDFATATTCNPTTCNPTTTPLPGDPQSPALCNPGVPGNRRRPAIVSTPRTGRAVLRAADERLLGAIGNEIGEVLIAALQVVCVI